LSPSAYVTKRKTKSGPRFVVRFRMGGRYSKLIHAGSFRKLGDAKARRDFVVSELAAGRDPIATLQTLATPPVRRTFAQAFDDFIASRVDVTDKTVKAYRNARDKIVPYLGDRDPHTLAPADFEQVIAQISPSLEPASIVSYLSAWRLVLDFCDVNPNPARSRKVRVPKRDQSEVVPPTGAEWRALRTKIAPEGLLLVRLLECLGLRIGEALSLTYGDIDFSEGRIRVSRARTKGRTAGQRWLWVPDELLDEIEALVPLEDRSRERRVFPGLHDYKVRQMMERACVLAGTVVYSPHDLRHRRVSLWVANGIDPTTVKTWTGHSRASMSLDVYSHVLIDPADDEWRDFWATAYGRDRGFRIGREVRVRSEEVEND
jgi:integrase